MINRKTLHRSAWMDAFDNLVCAGNPALSGRIEWDTATHFYLSDKTAPEAAALYLALASRRAQQAPASAVNLDLITEDLLAAALDEDDVDEALYPLQQAAGITDGGVAGMVFCSDSGTLCFTKWAQASQQERRAMLDHWIEIERIHLGAAGAL